MVIQPRVRGFICTTAHPEGCAAQVHRQIQVVQGQGPVAGPKNVLVIGASTGYGLASRIVAAFGSGAATIGVMFEKPSADNRTATAGWYNTAAFETAAHEAGYYAKSVNGDAFSDEVKDQVIQLIREDLGTVDLVVYSLASPRRKHPKTEELLSSVIKPIGSSYTNKTVDVGNGQVTDVTIAPATDDEIRQTIGVMGGEDWAMWIDALQNAGVLADNAVTVAYSYIGPQVTHSIYRHGTIGKAKDDLEATAKRLNERLSRHGGGAYVSVNKAVVTQSSSAIPVVPLYISLLFKVMKERGLHEGCIEQMYRLFAERLYSGNPVPVDEQGRIRLDELEMKSEVQAEVDRLWDSVHTDNLLDLADLEGYHNDFLKLFGFATEGIAYESDVDPVVAIPSIH